MMFVFTLFAFLVFHWVYTKHAFFFFFCDVLQVQAVLKRKEEEDQQMQQLIQTLQASLEKEKSKVKDLKEQVMGHLFIYLF